MECLRRRVKEIDVGMAQIAVRDGRGRKIETTDRGWIVQNLALVLGGGGAAGNAWLIGIIAGLAEAGVDLTQAADLVVGTSSGATAAAHVRSGRPPAQLFAAVLSEPVPSAGQSRERPPSLPLATVFERMRALSAAAASAADLQRAWARSGWRATPSSDPLRRDNGALWSPPGCLAMNGRTSR